MNINILFLIIPLIYSANDHLDVCGIGCPSCRPDGTCMSDCFGGFNNEDDCQTCATGYINFPFCESLCGNFFVDEGEECDGSTGCTENCTCDNGYVPAVGGGCLIDTSNESIGMDVVCLVVLLVACLIIVLYTLYLTYAKKYRLLREDGTSNTSHMSTNTSDSSSEGKGKRSHNTGTGTGTGTHPSIGLGSHTDHSTTSSMTDTDTNTSTDTSSDNTDRSTKRRRRAIFRQRGDVYTKIPERRFFSSTPSFPLELSKNTLLFGSTFEKLKVRVPYTDDFSIVNMRNSPWDFVVKEIKNPKYEILVDPIEGTIPPGMQVNIIAQIKLKCSCRVNAELVVQIKHQEKMYTSNIDIRGEGQESEYIDGDELDLDNAIAEEINVGQCYHLIWKQRQIFVKTFNKTDNPDNALKTEVRFLQVLNEQQFASKYYGKAVSHKVTCIVLEYYPLGTLEHFLEEQTISLKMKRKMITEIIQAISILHSFHYIYRQLNPTSILVSSVKLAVAPHIKLCGCTQMIRAETVSSIKQNAKNNYNFYYDPAVFVNSKADYTMDIFSLGHILALIYLGEPITEVCGVSPHELTTTQSTGGKAFDMDTIDPPSQMNLSFAQLVYSCWNDEKSERPSMAELTKSVRTVPLKKKIEE